MFKKLLDLFRPQKQKAEQSKPKRTTKPSKSKSKSKVASTRIGELGEHKINIQLDQLPKDYRCFSDVMLNNKKSRTGYSQIDHIVISPHAIFVIETKNYNGKIKGSRDDLNWTVNGRFKMYNPIKQNFGHIKALEDALASFPHLTYISMISFTMRCRFSIDPSLREIGSNELVLYDVELSEYIARKVNRMKATGSTETLTSEQIEAIAAVIQQVNITDPEARAAHVKLAKGE